MQNIEYLKDQNAVLVPLEQWEKLQSELVKLKKRVKKAEILNNFKSSLTNLKKDLQDKNYDPQTEISADEFLAELNNAE